MKYLLLLILVTPLWATEEVRNGLEPQGKAYTLTFTEKWRLGVDNDEDALIWSGSAVMVKGTSKGTLYVLDPGGYRLVKISPEGKLLAEIGGKGQGPGEMVAPTSLSVLADDTLVVSENRDGVFILNFFDGEGKFLRRENGGENTSLEHANLSPNGKYLGVLALNYPDGGGLHGSVGLLARDYQPRKELINFDLPELDPLKADKAETWVDYLAHWFKLLPAQGLISFGPDGSIYTARGDRYEITRHDGELKPVLKISREFKPRRLPRAELLAMVEPIHEEVLSALPSELAGLIDEKVIEAAVEKAELPPRKPPIFGMLAMPDGRLLVAHDHNPSTGKTEVDIFGKDGRYEGRANLPPVVVNLFPSYYGHALKMHIDKQAAYLIEKNDGDYSLVAYSYKLQ